MLCEHCGDLDGQETGPDHDERDCPWHADEPWTGHDLEAVLRQTADGNLRMKAAVDLLSEHGVWLARLAKRTDLFAADEDTHEVYDLDWPAIATAVNDLALPATGSELRILGLAASLASDAPVRLGDAVTGLDATNLRLVLDAIAMANGRPYAA
ncbi:hypothetical protein [Streptomyces cylindrosporus]|uniref:Uncharacterized protein n=1 Tax=Streptomyces cylindrosporus TaxID=2927583 RepID=A0ABS9YD58_9ACTN|nr:hypothetical protein [Streptomyces cylindrosporus]MCI3274556.1 hypothetical protein [Streptomyces cylindrosporus]